MAATTETSDSAKTSVSYLSGVTKVDFSKSEDDYEKYDIVLPSTKVVDTTSGFTLAQLFASYLDYIKKSFRPFKGKNEPKNHQNVIWIDTSSSQSVGDF